MTPADSPRPQPPLDRSADAGDAASQELNRALRMSFRVLKIAIALMAVVFLGSGLFQVQQDEEAIVLRFGSVVTRTDDEGEHNTFGAGLKFAWPFLIDEVLRFPIERIESVVVDDFWFKEQAEAAGQKIPPSLKPGREGFNLTGDANILHTHWRVNYRIADPVKYCRLLADPPPKRANGGSRKVSDLLNAQLRSAVIHVLSTYKVDDAYRQLDDSLRDDVQGLLGARLDALDTGIVISDVVVKPRVPRQVKDAFDDVINAEQENSRLREAARGDAEKIEREAEGEASRILAEAHAYARRVTAQANADARYIQDILRKHGDNPNLLQIYLRQRLLEGIEETLASAEEVFVVEPGGEVRIIVNRDPKIIKEPKRGPEGPPTEPPHEASE